MLKGPDLAFSTRSWEEDREAQQWADSLRSFSDDLAGAGDASADSLSWNSDTAAAKQPSFERTGSPPAEQPRWQQPHGGGDDDSTLSNADLSMAQPPPPPVQAPPQRPAQARGRVELLRRELHNDRPPRGSSREGAASRGGASRGAGRGRQQGAGSRGGSGWAESGSSSACVLTHPALAAPT